VTLKFAVIPALNAANSKHRYTPCSEKVVYLIFGHNVYYRSYDKLEIRSMERGICPIATLALHLTLYSLTGSRFDP